MVKDCCGRDGNALLSLKAAGLQEEEKTDGLLIRNWEEVWLMADPAGLQEEKRRACLIAIMRRCG